MKYICTCLVMTALLFWSAAVGAQNARGVPVYEKSRPDYDAPGIRAGGFTLKPELTLGMEYNDNIYATKKGTESDWIATVKPNFEVRSNWSRHALGLNAGAEAGMYTSKSDENYIDAHIFLDGRLDVLRESFLNLQAGFQRLHEERGSPDDLYAWKEPALYYKTSSDVSYFHGLGKISVTAGAGFVNYDYKRVDLRDGGSQSLDLRDRNQYNLNARVAYELHPDMQPFLTSEYEWRRYDKSAAKRDSDGYRIGLGTGFDLGGITSGEIYGGYMKQKYDDRKDISGFWYGMGLLWNVTEMTSLQADVQSSVKETTLSGSSGIDAVDAQLRVDHELLRNLLIGAFFDYTHDSYIGVDVTDEYYSLGPRLTYLWNRNLSSEVKYTYKDKSSNKAAREYTENRFSVSITGEF